MLNVYRTSEKSVIIFGSEVDSLMNIQQRDNMCIQTTEEARKRYAHARTRTYDARTKHKQKETTKL